MGGIGSGINSGGFREGSGRKPGSRNKKSLALIEQAERDDQLMPITFLLDTMRNVSLPMATRLQAANIAAPYLHVRLTALRVTGDPNQLSDAQLLGHIAQLEEIVAAMPERDHVAALEDKLEHTLEEAQQLSQNGRETFFRKMIEDGEAGLRRSHEPPPGAVLRRPGDDRLHQPAPEPRRVLEWDPAKETLKPVY